MAKWPDAPHGPSVKLVEEIAGASFAIVVAPSADDWVDLLNQFLRVHRRFASGQSPYLVLEVLDGLLPRVGVEVLRAGSTADFARSQLQCSVPPFDLVT